MLLFSGLDPIARVGLDDPDLGAAELSPPDAGSSVRELAGEWQGGAFDPGELAGVSAATLGYRPTWLATRYTHYGLPWDITGLRLESLHPGARALPWIVLVHGGSANLYEFFVTPRNDPGLGQFLAQKLNVLLVTIPGNYRAGGWMEPPEFRSPQYLLDKDLAPGEVSLRNAIFTNALILTGLKRLISAHLDGDLLIVGHSTGGELSFLAAGDKELGPRCRGRFLGWGSGGPSRWRREWEVATERRARKLREMATFPFVSHLRKRGAEEYVGSGYVGKLNPCEGATPLATASDWLIREGRRRPNFKQVLQDVEHSEAVELRERFEGEIREVASIAPLSIDVEAVLRDLMVPVPEPVGPWQRMAWVVGRADRGHWNEGAGHVAREMFVRDRFAASCPGVAAQVVVVDAPLTHYGHIEAPRELAALLVRTVEGLAG